MFFKSLRVVALIFVCTSGCSLIHPMCKLRNGTTYPVPIVRSLLPLLKLALAENFVAAVDLVEKCKNEAYSYPPCGPDMGGQFSIKYLNERGLVDEGGKVLHESTRDIVLSAVDGKGFDLRFVDPVQTDYTNEASSGTIQFCVPAPMDKYWNTGLPECVLQVKDEKPEDPWGSLTVIAPESFRSRWSSVCKRYVLACQGPAREKLPFEDYVRFVHDLKPDLPLPKGFELK